MIASFDRDGRASLLGSFFVAEDDDPSVLGLSLLSLVELL